jgi:hypothetical protein
VQTYFFFGKANVFFGVSSPIDILLYGISKKVNANIWITMIYTQSE